MAIRKSLSRKKTGIKGITEFLNRYWFEKKIVSILASVHWEILWREPDVHFSSPGKIP